MTTTAHTAKPFPWIIVTALAVLPLLGWWQYGLFDLDEGFYGAVTAEMNREGEWLIPRLNGKPWFEKPILLYWAAKPCLALFGDALGLRLPSVLATLATYALLAWFARRRLAAATAQLTVLVLGSSLLFVGVGRMLMTDPLLVLFFTGTLVFFWESLVGDRRWRLASAACLGLAVLAKGPVACVLLVPILAYTFWREPELRPAFRQGWLAGALVFAAVVASWYGSCYVRHGERFVQEFLIEQNLNRFLGGDQAHHWGGVTGWFFYVPVLFLGMFPWSLLVARAWPRRCTDMTPEAALRRFLATWALVVLMFFTVSGAKLPHYILPAFPPLALLVADTLMRRPLPAFAGRRSAWLAACPIVAAAAANAGFLWWYVHSGQAEAHGLARYVQARGGDVAFYQISRRPAVAGAARPLLQETSLPSLFVYVDRRALATDEFDDLLKAARPLWVLTRADRVLPVDFARAEQAGAILREAVTPLRQEHFRLLRLDESPTSASAHAMQNREGQPMTRSIDSTLTYR
jgi:4-amino-4-deoxy-L-arabinose transferase-like glycosyltransferase